MIIGLCGKARSGKDTVAKLLGDCHEEGVARIQIAGPLKAYLRLMFDWTLDHTDGDLKDVPDKRYPRKCLRCTHPVNPKPGYIDVSVSVMGYSDPHWQKCPLCSGEQVTHLTPREAMQKLGGEWAESTYPAVYAEKAARQAKDISGKGPLAVVTDCRFLRDIQAIIGVGGVIVEVTREDPNKNLDSRALNHGSETAIDGEDFQGLVKLRCVSTGTPRRPRRHGQGHLQTDEPLDF